MSSPDLAQQPAVSKAHKKPGVKQSVTRALCPPSPLNTSHDSLVDHRTSEEEEGALFKFNQDYDLSEQQDSNYYKMGFGAPPVGGNISPMGVSLPVLPKPLADLKTAETRTFLSKLIWLGNGGRRPQYGNPETKPCWWPQHILPWEDMKKMGGRKSVELSHINYTEVLKQCLAAGYEYFGYDPSTYFSSECSEEPNFGIMEDSSQATGLMDDTEMEEEELGRQEGVLEIDLDQVEACGNRVTAGSEQNQILCK